ncbi:flagellar hook-basal body protein [Paenibacillus sp. HN-1]|uniref:flagellar hook-basal body protein n=1 Tax=Paenibacillus TaxID=44249 RepID=UPI001CA7F563|nr:MULTISPECIES: flagellar hook-basal body protein [Paenibacillus]MBY9077635.1 flagellar hook-basal body protein [Paenibacillus sp. CGMCC 1.18879]MBY9087440.1 flagellar hook-basal body protein [Paenibacillus sinensis]
MIRGLYTAAAGMVTEQRRHDTATQNIANMNTTGYKQVESLNHSFPEVLISAMQNGTTKPIGKLNTGVFAEQSMSKFIQGDLVNTTKTTDFALSSDLSVTDPTTGQNIIFDQSGKYIDAQGQVTYQPQAFFTVQDTDGNQLYTRNGSFTVDATGNLLSSGGYKVLGTNGQPVNVGGLRSVDDLRVDDAGRVINAATGADTGIRLGVSIATNPQNLVRDGNGVFHADDLGTAGIRYAAAGDNVQVRQGYIEGSNVDVTQVTVDLNAAYRAYEANQKVVQFYDSTLDKAVNSVGKV